MGTHRPHQVVHAVIARRLDQPHILRWYVRHVIVEGHSVTRDRVIAQGEREHRPGSQSVNEMVSQCLREALEQLAD